MALREHDRVGAYVVKRCLADGSFVADREGLAGFQKTVVLHVLESDDPEQVDVFLRDARMAAQLTHTNIAQIIDVGADGGRHYMAVESVDGISLLDATRRMWSSGHGLPLEVITRVGAQAATALAAAHAVSADDGTALVHGALGPDRLMLTRDGTVKLLGLGVPQRVRIVDPRDDLRALGATMAFCITGRMPKAGEQLDVVPLAYPGKLEQVLRDLLDVASDGDVPPDPKKIAARIARSLTPSAGNILAGFVDRALLMRPVDASEAVTPVPANVAIEEGLLASSGEYSTAEFKVRPGRRGVLIGAGVVAVVVLLVIAFAIVRTMQARPPRVEPVGEIVVPIEPLAPEPPAPPKPPDEPPIEPIR